MSEHSHAVVPPGAEKFDAKHLGGLSTILLGAGAVGIIGSFIGAFISPVQFAYSWLFAFIYFFTICVGALFWTCLHHATDAAWSVLVRRQLENVAGLLPIFFVLFLPLILFCGPSLWKWWNVIPGDDPLLDAKQPYLSHGFFWIRYILYFVLLSWVALTLSGRSKAQDIDGAGSHTATMRKFGVGGIPTVGLCLTFAGFDWLMGLNYHWYSTMWGVYLFAGAAGSSMSLLVLIITALKRRGYLTLVNMEHYHIMGKFMLAFTIFWAYIGFSQYMLIWYANIPEETVWFRLRNVGFWHALSTLLVFGRFFLPFPVLLLQWTKKKPQYLCMVAGWVLFMQFLDMYVIVLPQLHQDGFSPNILDLLSWVGIGGIVGWAFLNKLSKSNLFPNRDPRLMECIKLTN